jgi:hypothetical protein
MKPARVLLFALLFLVAFAVQPTPERPYRAPVSPEPEQGSPHVRKSARNLSSLASDLQGATTRHGSGAAQTVGGMWMEVDRLKRQGQNVRAIEYYLSDLEASKGRGEQGAAASRYAGNNLEYEIQRLNRRIGR